MLLADDTVWSQKQRRTSNTYNITAFQKAVKEYKQAVNWGKTNCNTMVISRESTT